MKKFFGEGVSNWVSMTCGFGFLVSGVGAAAGPVVADDLLSSPPLEAHNSGYYYEQAPRLQPLVCQVLRVSGDGASQSELYWGVSKLRIAQTSEYGGEARAGLCRARPGQAAVARRPAIALQPDASDHKRIRHGIEAYRRANTLTF
ncbi:MAG TPA: hypothetical protein ENI17_13245 [Pseudomonas xinjiangensis]|uniref:Uncharacterized protein n=2 Tax=root TaxID=1 RepID=A0A7V1BP29_9GAMM|nr:hypothetical protein [Halopseudomonas xinjiangensis]HEC48575.1 hypothetical protein [Halopseudomonas xinjiangensis]